MDRQDRISGTTDGQNPRQAPISTIQARGDASDFLARYTYNIQLIRDGVGNEQVIHRIPRWRLIDPGRPDRVLYCGAGE